MRLTMAVKLNGVMVSLGLLAVGASFFAVLSQQVSSQETMRWQQSARAGRVSVATIEGTLKSLRRDISRYAREERGRSFFAADIDRQMLMLTRASYALQDGIQAQQDKFRDKKSRSQNSVAPAVATPGITRMRAQADELVERSRQLDASWRQLKKLKAAMAVYWGRTGENKKLEYILLSVENALGRKPGNTAAQTIAAALPPGQKKFLTKGLPLWVAELKKADLPAAELLQSLHAQLLLLLTLSDPVLSQGMAAGDGEMVTIAEVLGRTRMAYQNWFVYVNRQLSALADGQRRLLTPINDQLADMHAGIAALERERASGILQAERVLFQRERDSRYLLAGIGCLALMILIPALFWAGQWSEKVTDQAQAMSRRCEQTVRVSRAIAQGWQRHIVYIVDQVAALSRLSVSLRRFFPEGLDSLPVISREEELVAESRVSLEQGLMRVKELKAVSSDVEANATEIQQVLRAIGDALGGIDGLLAAAGRVSGAPGLGQDSQGQGKIERAVALLSRVKAAVRYAEKILLEQHSDAARAGGLSLQVNQQFERMGEIAHQMMAMIARLTEEDERQRECWADVMREMGRVIQALQTSAGEIKISRVLSGEVHGHLEDLQELAADFSVTAGVVNSIVCHGQVAPDRASLDDQEVARQDAGLTMGEQPNAVLRPRDEQGREKERLRREQVEQYFEMFLRSPQLVASMQEATV